MAKRSGKSVERTAIYVIAGKDQPLVSAEYTKLIDKLIEPDQRAMGLYVTDEKAEITEVLDELSTLPFLADKRVVAVRNADKFVSAHRELLEKYFDKPSPSGTLVLTVTSWPGNTKLAKKLKSAGELISVEPLKGRQLTAKLIDYTSDAYGKKLGPGSADILVELLGEDIIRLYGEIDKLATYADDEKSITVKHIEQLTGHNRLFDAFGVIDSCLAGNVASAASRLRRMFEDDKSAEYRVIGAFAFQLRRMFTAKALLEGGCNQFEAGKRAGIWHNKEAVFQRLRSISLKRLGRQLQRLAEIDYAVKRGQGQIKVEMERVVLGLAVQKRR